MALTPLEIRNREFKKVFRGYDEEDVDTFIKQVLDEYEKLYKENIDLKEALRKKDGDISEYRGIEDTLKNTLVMAQQAAEEAARNARDKAENTLKEAELKAQKIVQEANRKIEKAAREYEYLKSQARMFRAKFQGFLEAQLGMVREDDMEEAAATNDEPAVAPVEPAPKVAAVDDAPLVELGKLVEKKAGEK